jgi:L-alanine-DL-glutamate epimerase-like enolase superfamily enzyme
VKITSVQTMRLSFPDRGGYADAQHRFGERAGVVVRLHTDAGLVGHGYIYLGVSIHAAPALQTLIERQLAPVLIGQDPFFPRRLRDRLWHEIEYAGVEGVNHLALTALDVACLGPHGARSLRVPGWKLLGACRERIPAYAMVGWYYDDDDAAGNLDHFKQAIAQAMQDEMAGVKIKVARGSLEEDVQRIEAARALVGKDGHADGRRQPGAGPR